MLNREILQRRFGLCWLKQSIPLFIHFFNFIFKSLKHFVNHFWFWWYVIKQQFTKIFNLLFIYCLSFVVPFDGSKVLDVKLEWDHSESTHQICYFFVLLVLLLPRRVSTLPFWAYNNLLYLALLRWPSIALLYNCQVLFMNIFLWHFIK